MIQAVIARRDRWSAGRRRPLGSRSRDFVRFDVHGSQLRVYPPPRNKRGVA
jgi:hypothetical protein